MSNKEAKTEATRYIDNGKEILQSKAKLMDGYYTDPKYVKLAGHAIYNGILVALDYKFPIIKQSNKRPHAFDYRDTLAKQNRKVLNHFNECYEILHLVAGYDGIGSKKVLQHSIEAAKEIINWATA